MNRIQIQGLLFSGLAVMTALLSLIDLFTDSASAVLIMAIMIFLLGVPHGALDPIFAQRRFSIRSGKSWLPFILIYLALMLLTILCWWYLPLFFMAAFLLLSAWHFSRDLTASTPMLNRLLYGGAIIVLPLILHQVEIIRLFSILIGPKLGELLAGTIQPLAGPWLLASSVGLVVECWHKRLAGLEMLAVCVLASLAEPLIAFTIYFCCMHSLRHILRTQQYAEASPSKLVKIALAPMAGTALIALLAWQYLPSSTDTSHILRILFVLLAALTLPHMLLIHEVDYRH